MASAEAAEVHWVTPVTPTALAHLESLPIPHYNWFFMGVDLTWLLPGPLNIPRLKDALSLTLRDFPHCAGRLLHNEQENSWRLRLANEPVSITVGKNDEIEVTDDFMAGGHPEISDSLVGFRLVLSKEMEEEPLLRFRVTEWKQTGETSISMALSHAVGDGAAMFHIMETFSAYYTDQAPPPPPTFEHFTDTPPQCPRAEVTSALPFLLRNCMDYPGDEMMKMYGLRMQATERIVMRFTKEQLNKLKDKANADSDSDITQSSMDALAGYLATVQNRIEKEPVREIHHAIGYRNMPTNTESEYKTPPPTSQGNVVMGVNSRAISASKSTTIGDYARLLRSSIRECQEPRTLANLIALTEELYGRAHTINRVFDYYHESGCIGFNSLYRVPYIHAHFGYEGKVRFFFGLALPRYFRVFGANPIKHVDDNGTIRWDSGVGDAEVIHGAVKGTGEKILEMVKQDMLALT